MVPSGAKLLKTNSPHQTDWKKNKEISNPHSSKFIFVVLWPLTENGGDFIQLGALKGAIFAVFFVVLVFFAVFSIFLCASASFLFYIFFFYRKFLDLELLLCSIHSLSLTQKIHAQNYCTLILSVNFLSSLEGALECVEEVINAGLFCCRVHWASSLPVHCFWSGYGTTSARTFTGRSPKWMQFDMILTLFFCDFVDFSGRNSRTALPEGFNVFPCKFWLSRSWILNLRLLQMVPEPIFTQPHCLTFRKFKFVGERWRPSKYAKNAKKQQHQKYKNCELHAYFIHLSLLFNFLLLLSSVSLSAEGIFEHSHLCWNKSLCSMQPGAYFEWWLYFFFLKNHKQHESRNVLQFFSSPDDKLMQRRFPLFIISTPHCSWGYAVSLMASTGREQRCLSSPLECSPFHPPTTHCKPAI